MKDAPDVLRFYKEWSARLTDDTTTVLRLQQVPPTPTNLLHLHGLQACAIGICHTDPVTADALHEQIRAFKTPAIDDLKLRSYSEMAQLDPASKETEVVSFGNLECLREFSNEFIDGLTKIADDYLPPLGLIELQQLGGALSASGESAAYTAPKSPFALHLVSPAMRVSLEELAHDTGKAFHALGDVYTGETSYNFLRADQQARVPSAFDTEKYAHLQSLKARYDPTNFFSFNMNITPE